MESGAFLLFKFHCKVVKNSGFKFLLIQDIIGKYRGFGIRS